ncbi:MAG: hypothetical protein JSU92_06615 [Deltaproteobacteria bacterium]|nr:MAG: hypothetical protein JSU92_06615 [Deltaproteobacteria bacterium]
MAKEEDIVNQKAEPVLSFDQIVEKVHREKENGSPVRDTTPLWQSTHIIMERERKFRKKYASAVRRLIRSFPKEVINTIRERVPIGSVSYSAYVDRNCPILKRGELVIGHGDYNAFGKIMLDLEALQDSTNTPQTARQQAIWLLLYSRLRLRPPSPVPLKCAKRLGLDLGHIQRLSQVFLEELVPLLEKEYGQDFFGHGSEQRKKFDEVLRRYTFLEDNQEYRDYVCNNTVILAIADYASEIRSAQRRTSDKSEKKIYQITANVSDSKSFFPRDFFAVAEGKVDSSLEQTISSLFISRTKRGEQYTVSYVLNQFAEENPNKFIIALVGSKKEADIYAAYINANAYRENDNRVKVIPIEQAEAKPLPDLVSVIRDLD